MSKSIPKNKTIEEILADLDENNPEYVTDWIIIELDSDPKSSSRARGTVVNGKQLFYEKKEDKRYKHLLTELLDIEFSDILEDGELIEGPIVLNMNLFKIPPKYIWEDERLLYLISKDILRPTTKPDFDNYGKIVCDVMNKKFIKDDSQIIQGNIGKYFILPDESPRIEIQLTFRLKKIVG